jgi:hypothetical protein
MIDNKDNLRMNEEFQLLVYNFLHNYLVENNIAFVEIDESNPISQIKNAIMDKLLNDR